MGISYLACRSLTTPDHCGACNAACPAAGTMGTAATRACMANRCACAAGRNDCDMDRTNGCETTGACM
jgi:hypothetical protein